MPSNAPKRRPIPKSRVKIGDRVTCIIRDEAYYSRYAGNPEMFFEPGMVGIVGSVDVPCTTYAYRRNGGTATFVCVDFRDATGREWRVGLYYNNVKPIKEQSQCQAKT